MMCISFFAFASEYGTDVDVDCVLRIGNGTDVDVDCVHFVLDMVQM